jgi:hypothetical protein
MAKEYTQRIIVNVLVASATLKSFYPLHFFLFCSCKSFDFFHINIRLSGLKLKKRKEKKKRQIQIFERDRKLISNKKDYVKA